MPPRHPNPLLSRKRGCVPFLFKPLPSPVTFRRLKGRDFFTSSKLPRFSRDPVDFLPNMVTVLALCCGLTAMRFAWWSKWDAAVFGILIAAVLDALDGRLARFLGSTSDFGAELDSLSDFVCFGCAPAMVIYSCSLSHWDRLGWVFCLFFTVCQALRLARFNVGRMTAHKVPWAHQFSIGVPAPAGAFIALLPLMAQLSFDVSPPPFVYCLSLAASGGLMLSRLPTFIFKNIRLTPRRMAPPLVMVGVVGAGLLTCPWGTLFTLGWVYLISIPWSVRVVRRMTHKG